MRSTGEKGLRSGWAGRRQTCGGEGGGGTGEACTEADSVADKDPCRVASRAALPVLPKKGRSASSNQGELASRERRGDTASMLTGRG